MKIKVTKSSLKPLAEQLVARFTEMGIVTSTGKPLVVDQAYEAIAALAGYRNQHVLRAALKKDESEPVTTEVKATVRRPEDVNQEQIEMLTKMGYRVAYSDFKQPYWEHYDCDSGMSDDASTDFGSVAEAWADAWEKEAAAIRTERKFTMVIWDGMGLPCQMLLMEGRAPTAMQVAMRDLQREWGAEHPYYIRAMWSQELSQGDTRLVNYWEWVVHQIEANGGDTEHCFCGNPLNDGRSHNGVCGDCHSRNKSIRARDASK